MHLSTAAQDFEQAKASCLLYKVGDSLYDDRCLGQDASYEANCLANDALFAGHGSGPYAVYSGKDTTVWPKRG